MPQMTSLRTFQLRTTYGHIIGFKAGEPQDVPDVCVQAAQEAGCGFVDPEEQAFQDDRSRGMADFQGDLRKSVLYLAVQSITADKATHTQTFNAGGTPKADAVAKRVGFPTTQDEVNTAFQLMLSAKQEGRDMQVHPRAPDIMRVIDAAERTELLSLAEEFGMPSNKAKALQSRELRKILLQKLGAATGE